MAVQISIKGEGLEFEREVSESIALQIIEIAMQNGQDVADKESEAPEEGVNGLPDSFFDRLSGKQEAFIRILLADGGWVGNEEIRERMEENHGESSRGPQAIAGIRAGFTRKHGDDFDVIRRRWAGSENEYKLREAYVDDIRNGLEQID